MSIENGGKDVVSFPRWFIQFIGASTTLFLVIFLPWAIWHTSTLMKVETIVNQNSVLIDKVDEISKITREEQIRTSQSIEYITELRGKFDSLEKRIREIEKSK